MTLSDELVKILVDKALVGGLLGISGFVVARLLEKYRRDQALILEIAKVRAAAVVETLSLVVGFDHEVVFFERDWKEAIRGVTPPSVNSEMTKLVERHNCRRDEVVKFLSTKHILIGDELTFEALDYLAACKATIEAIISGNEDARLAAGEETDKSRHTLGLHLVRLSEGKFRYRLRKLVFDSNGIQMQFR